MALYCVVAPENLSAYLLSFVLRSPCYRSLTDLKFTNKNHITITVSAFSVLAYSDSKGLILRLVLLKRKKK